MPQMTIRISEELKARLAAIAQHDDRTPHYIALKALNEFLERAEVHHREIDITRERLRNYELTGKSVPMDEARAYVASLRAKASDAAA